MKRLMGLCVTGFHFLDVRARALRTLGQRPCDGQRESDLTPRYFGPGLMNSPGRGTGQGRSA